MPVDTIRGRFKWEAVGYASVVSEAPRFVPDEFREPAEKDL
jgi:DNA polymerase IV